MSTPPEEPRYATGYGGARYPLPDGAPPPAPPAPAGQGDGRPQPQYSPYGPYSPPPAGLDDGADIGVSRARPGVMVVGLVLMIIAAVPFLLFGVAFLVIGLSPETLPAETLEPLREAAGVADVGVVALVLLVLGVVSIVLSALYVLFVVLAFTGRNWARILVAVMTTAVSLVMLYLIVSAAAADPLGVLVLLVPVLLAVGGLVTWFLPQVNRWYAAR